MKNRLPTLPYLNLMKLSHISLDFNAFIAISLRLIAMFWIMENHFMFVGIFVWRNT